MLRGDKAAVVSAGGVISAACRARGEASLVG